MNTGGAMRLLKIKERTVTKLPLIISIPETFIRKNEINKGDIIEYYISEFGDLIIKKKEI